MKDCFKAYQKSIEIKGNKNLSAFKRWGRWHQYNFKNVKQPKLLESAHEREMPIFHGTYKIDKEQRRALKVSIVGI